MLDNNDLLKQQVLINHFTNATGCTVEQANQFLLDSRWQFEAALSAFFQESSVINHQRPNLNPLHAPSNTPATPPSLTDTLLALHKLGTEGTQWATPCSPMNTQSTQKQVLQQVNPVNPFERQQVFCGSTGGSDDNMDTESEHQINNQNLASQSQPVVTSAQGSAPLMFPITN